MNWRKPKSPWSHVAAVLIVLALPVAALKVAAIYNTAPGRELVRVASVIDGDTIRLVDGRTVRLAWIDAPELDQEGGAEAKSDLEKMVLDRSAVIVVYGTEQRETTQVVAGVLADGITDVNFMMLRSGNAWYIDHESHARRNQRDADQYRWAHDVARRQRFGLWEKDKPVPPWEWRRQHPYHVQSCGEYPEPVSLPIKVVSV